VRARVRVRASVYRLLQQADLTASYRCLKTVLFSWDLSHKGRFRLAYHIERFTNTIKYKLRIQLNKLYGYNKINFRIQ